MPHLTPYGARSRAALGRRHLLAAAAACVLPAPGQAAAAPWPDRPLRLVVPFPAGSGPDLLARAIAPTLQARLGQPVVVDNRSGAGGAIGTQLIAQATDGHTIGVSVGGPATTARLLDPALAYDPMRDLAPIALLARLPYLLVARPGLGARDVVGLAGLAARMADGLAAGSIGTGTVSHLLMAELAVRHGFALVHVPYRGYPQLLLDLVPGRIDAGFVAASHVLTLLAEQRVAALATTGAERLAAAPDVPTLAEAGEPGAPAEAWIGLFAPATMPAPRVAQIAALAHAALATETVAATLAASGFTGSADGPEAFGHLRAAEAARWGALIQRLGLRQSS